MPRYYFAVHDGTSSKDEEGVELPNLNAAKSVAVRYASALMAESKTAFWENHGWYMDVTDEKGLVLLRLDFAANVSPAVA